LPPNHAIGLNDHFLPYYDMRVIGLYMFDHMYHQMKHMYVRFSKNEQASVPRKLCYNIRTITQFLENITCEPLAPFLQADNNTYVPLAQKSEHDIFAYTRKPFDYWMTQRVKYTPRELLMHDLFASFRHTQNI
jgi:hypothetical protein